MSETRHYGPGSDEGGRTWAIIASLINSAKLIGIDPQEYLTDVLERIVGDIRDEYDAEAEAQVVRLGEGRFVADAAVSVDELSSHVGRQLPADGAFEALGGLLVHRAGRVPPVGAGLQLAGLKFTVREADEPHVVRVDIEVLDPRAPRPSA